MTYILQSDGYDGGFIIAVLDTKEDVDLYCQVFNIDSIEFLWYDDKEIVDNIRDGRIWYEVWVVLDTGEVRLCSSAPVINGREDYDIFDVTNISHRMCGKKYLRSYGYFATNDEAIAKAQERRRLYDDT